MTIEFKPIKIISFDDQASYKSDPNSALVNAILKLSSPASPEWADDFNHRWKQHFYMMKRKAHVYGDRLETYCVPEEIQGLINEFNKVIAETNQAYEQHLARQQQEAAKQAAATAAERENLAKIKNNLKFN